MYSEKNNYYRYTMWKNLLIEKMYEQLFSVNDWTG